MWCDVLFDVPERPHAWYHPDLCNCCIFGATDAEKARRRSYGAYIRASRRSGRAPGFLEVSAHAEQVMRICVRIEAEQRRAVG